MTDSSGGHKGGGPYRSPWVGAALWRKEAPPTAHFRPVIHVAAHGARVRAHCAFDLLDHGGQTSYSDSDAGEEEETE